MGVILDSSILITAERQGNNARQMLSSVAYQLGNTEIALSVLTLLELAHGAARADTSERKANREEFINELLTAMPIYGVTAAVALRTGQIDGWNQAKGVRLPLADLLIGVTALELGYGVATRNVRHFRMIPGLSVTQF
jgi:predicted nucleic acid-binding protein